METNLIYLRFPLPFSASSILVRMRNVTCKSASREQVSLEDSAWHSCSFQSRQSEELLEVLYSGVPAGVAVEKLALCFSAFV